MPGSAALAGDRGAGADGCAGVEGDGGVGADLDLGGGHQGRDPAVIGGRRPDRRVDAVGPRRDPQDLHALHIVDDLEEPAGVVDVDHAQRSMLGGIAGAVHRGDSQVVAFRLLVEPDGHVQGGPLTGRCRRDRTAVQPGWELARVDSEGCGGGLAGGQDQPGGRQRDRPGRGWLPVLLPQRQRQLHGGLRCAGVGQRQRLDHRLGVVLRVRK